MWRHSFKNRNLTWSYSHTGEMCIHSMSGWSCVRTVLDLLRGSSEQSRKYETTIRKEKSLSFPHYWCHEKKKAVCLGWNGRPVCALRWHELRVWQNPAGFCGGGLCGIRLRNCLTAFWWALCPKTHLGLQSCPVESVWVCIWNELGLQMDQFLSYMQNICNKTITFTWNMIPKFA